MSFSQEVALNEWCISTPIKSEQWFAVKSSSIHNILVQSVVHSMSSFLSGRFLWFRYSPFFAIALIDPSFDF